MPFTNDGLDPEAIKVLEECLDAAVQQASAYVTVNDNHRSVLASAIIQGWDHGLHDPKELTEFALRAIPAVRLRRS